MAKRNSKKITDQSNEPIQLNLAVLADYRSDIDDITTVTIADGKFQFKINKYFKTTIIDEKLIPDLQAAFTTLKIDKVNMNDLSDTFMILIMCILKNFTNLGLGFLDMSKESDVRKLVAVAKELYDKEIFTEIASSIPESEMLKVKKQLELSKVLQNQINELFTSIALSEQEKMNAEQVLTESENSGHIESEPIAEGTSKED